MMVEKSDKPENTKITNAEQPKEAGTPTAVVQHDPPTPTSPKPEAKPEIKKESNGAGNGTIITHDQNGAHMKSQEFGEPQARAFCVALRQYQAPLKLQGEDPGEFVPQLKNTTLAWVNCRVKDMDKEAIEVAGSFGFSSNLVEGLLNSRHSGYEDRETEMGLMLPAIRVDKLDVKWYPLLILIKDGVVFTIHPEEVVRLVRFSRYSETFMRKIPVNILMKDKLAMMLERIIDENNERNFEGIRSIEEESDEVGRMLSDPKTPMVKLSPVIYDMKHALITYLNLLWATQNVIHSLRYGDPELLTDDPDLLEKLEVLGEDVTRHIQLGENLSEVLASGLEVLQGIYNNQLQIVNNKMALVLTWLTILGTAFLVPNTLATAMSNPAYNLQPADAGWYTIMLIVSTILATWASWWFVKRKGLLPDKLE